MMLAQRYNLPAPDLLRGSRLSIQHVENDRTLVTGRQEVAMLRNLVAAVPQERHLGVLAGRLTQLTSLGTLGFVYFTAPTLWAGLEAHCRFLTLTWSMCQLAVEQVGDTVVLTYRPGELPSDVAMFYLQREAAAAVHLARATGFEGSVRAEFPWAEPTGRAALDQYLGLFGEAPVFGAPVTSLTVDAAVLHQSREQFARQAHLRFLDEASQELRDYGARFGVSGQVRQLLRAGLEVGVSEEQVAGSLLTSPRTLRRQLALEGSSFRMVLEEVRREHADRLLADPGLTVAQISVRLGYENAPAFTAAFRRWHGITPTEFRAGGRSA